MQLESKRASQMAVKAEKDRTRNEMMDELERLEKSKLLKDQKKREKMINFNKELAALLEERKQQFLIEQTKAHELDKLQIEDSQVQQQIIQEERNRIINEFKTSVGETTY